VFVIEEGGAAVYQESHTVTTDANGIAIVNIGEGTVMSGSFQNINWGSDRHFLVIDLDTGSGLTDMGRTEFRTVPYALSSGDSAKNLDDLSDTKVIGSSIYIGKQSGKNTSGEENTSLGAYSLNENTYGSFNVAVGTSAMQYNKTGRYNIAIGGNALHNNISGWNNIMIGHAAGLEVTGENNIFIGNGAGGEVTTSNKLYIENSDSQTPLIGGDFSTDEVVINGTLQITGGTPSVGKVLTSDANGKASWGSLPEVGVNNLNDLSDVIYDGQSLYIGYNSGLLDDDSNYNTSVGRESMKANTSGRQNVSFGAQTLISNKTGSYNVALGEGSLYKNISGNRNVSIGEKAGFNSLGDGNVFIGHNAGEHETGNNKLYIENSSSSKPLIEGDFYNDEVVINGDLTVTKEIQAPDSGSADMKAYAYGFVNSDGSIDTASSSGGFTVSLIGNPCCDETYYHYEISFTGSDKPTDYHQYMVIVSLSSKGSIYADRFGSYFKVEAESASGGAGSRKSFSFVVYKK